MARMKVSKRYRLSKRELKRFRQELLRQYPGFPIEPENVEYAKVGEVEIYIINGKPSFFLRGNRLVPLLLFLIKEDYSWLPRVYVDPGATRAVGRGADLMVPGIRRVEGSFEPGMIVAIVDESTKVPVAVGEALMSSGEILERLSGERRGRALRNIHRPGDEAWEASKVL